MNRASILEMICTFVQGSDDAKRAAPGTGANLFDEGYFDSMKIVNLVLFVEERFKVTLEYDDLTEENLSTIDQIVGMIDGKLRKIGTVS